MLFLESLDIVNFRNISRLSLQFSREVNCFTGENGMGKTSILDAIHYACMTRSYFTGSDQAVIRQDQDFFRLAAAFSTQEADQKEVIVVKYPRGERKQVLCNEVPYNRLLDHIGRYPVLVFAPDDVYELQAGSEERRRYFDAILCQVDPRYLQYLSQYVKALEHRNAYLRQAHGQGFLDENLLAGLDEQLCRHAPYLSERRQTMVQDLNPDLNLLYEKIAGRSEPVEIRYQSDLEVSDLPELLKRDRDDDLVAGRTRSGIHKDDFQFSIQGMVLKKHASQGQMKSFVVSLKLAQFQFMRQAKGFAPLFLLDDIFDKLDMGRILRLVDILRSYEGSQLFISDTDPGRVQEVLGRLGHEYRMFTIRNGSCEEAATHHPLNKS